MEVKLFKEDIRPEFQNLPIWFLDFEHLTDDAQKVLVIVGRGVYLDNITNIYEAIYPPPSDKKTRRG